MNTLFTGHEADIAATEAPTGWDTDVREQLLHIIDCANAGLESLKGNHEFAALLGEPVTYTVGHYTLEAISACVERIRKAQTNG